MYTNMEGAINQVILEPVKETVTPVKREDKFSDEESLLLCSVMGEKNQQFPKYTNHQLIKVRFGQGVSSQTKKSTWKLVADKYNASAEKGRTSDKLEKKWLNLSSKHRMMYMDYLKDSKMTGGGSALNKGPSFITMGVMAVLGVDSVSVLGAGDESCDSTVKMLKRLRDAEDETRVLDSEMPRPKHLLTATVDVATASPDAVEPSVTSVCTCCCHSHTLEQLKKQKMLLQIEMYKKKLKLM